MGAGSTRTARYHLDPLGTPDALTDEKGHLVWMASYSSYSNRPYAKSSTRQDYIDARIMGEVEADDIRHQIYSELGANTVMKTPYGHSACQNAPKNKKVQVVKDRFVGPNAVYTASIDGKTYTDYYGDIWDKYKPTP